MSEIDLLSVYDNLPKGQEYAVIGCIEPDKNKYNIMCFLEFIKKIGLIKSILDIDLDDFADFKQINSQYLYEKYGELENVISMYKLYGSYPTEHKAKNIALSLKNESMQGNVFIQKVGAWVPFNPPDNLVENTTCSDKKMNELMNQEIKNKEKTRQVLENQKKALLQKKEKTKKKNVVDLQIPSSKDTQLMNTIQDVINTSEQLMGSGIVSNEFKEHYENVKGTIEDTTKKDEKIKPIKLVGDKIKALKISEEEIKK